MLPCLHRLLSSGPEVCVCVCATLAYPRFARRYLNTYGNLGPIVDFTVADLDRRGQKQIVTCSGAKKEGSLRVVRNGIGVVSQAEVEIVGIKNMITWSVDNFDRYLVMSVAGETRVLEIEGDEMGECEVAGMGVGVTLAGGNVGSDFLQVRRAKRNDLCAMCGTCCPAWYLSLITPRRPMFFFDLPACLQSLIPLSPLFS